MAFKPALQNLLLQTIRNKKGYCGRLWDQKQTMTKSAPILSLKDIHCAYGDYAAVNGVSLTIKAGEILCLLGASGCGKTTTLRAAAGVERPVDGEIEIAGVTMSGNGVFVAPEHRHVGLMFQDYALFPHLSVIKNVMFGLSDLPKKARAEQAKKMLALVGMEDRADAYPHELSGGQQQRVALARALAPNPRVMLMDEPFSGLDRAMRTHVRNETISLLKQLGTATLIVTHDPEEAIALGDRVAVMRDGKIIACDEYHKLPPELLDCQAEIAMLAAQ